MNPTSEQYNLVVKECRILFSDKLKDYGTAWRILRPSSLTDQIFIKAQRIRSIEEKGMSRVEDGIKPEFVGIVNYSVIALIQIELGNYSDLSLSSEEAIVLYDKYISAAKMLMEDKNHDYSEAWREMRTSSLTDIILMKLYRIKQIEDNQGMTKVSEGVDASYYDIINYAVFTLIKMMENEAQ